MDLVTAVEQQLGQVRAVLARDAGDQGTGAGIGGEGYML